MGFSVLDASLFGLPGKNGDKNGYPICYSVGAKGQPFPTTFFEEYNGGADDDANVRITSVTGAFLSFLPLNIQYPILTQAKFIVDEYGCANGEIILNTLPDFPLLTFSSVSFQINGKNVYKGEIYEDPSPGTNPKNGYSYKLQGLRKRLEDVTIINELRWNIFSITPSGLDCVIVIQANALPPVNLATIEIGQKVFVLDTVDDANTGFFEILDKSATSITIHNPAAASQSVIKGTISILPKEWGDPITRISNLFSQVAFTYINNVPILKSLVKIEATTSDLTSGSLDLEKLTVWKFMDVVRKMLGPDFYTGVDAEGFIFLKKKQTGILDQFFIGYDFHDAEIKYDRGSVFNIIEVERQVSRDEPTSNWISVYETSDPTSIAKFGRKKDQPIKVPFYCETPVCAKIGNNALAFKKNPKVQIKVKNAKFREYELGDYRIVTSPGYFTQTIDEMDSLSFWFESDNTKITKSLSNTNLITGAYSHRLLLEDASGTSYKKSLNIKKFGLREIHIWISGSVVGEYIYFGIGKNSSLENETPIQVRKANEFFPFIWDVSNLNIRDIGEIGFRFASNSGDPLFAAVYIDEIATLSYTSLDFTLPLVEVEYNLSPTPKRSFCNLTFGSKDNRLDTYFSSYNAQIQTLGLVARKK